MISSTISWRNLVAIATAGYQQTEGRWGTTQTSRGVIPTGVYKTAVGNGGKDYSFVLVSSIMQGNQENGSYWRRRGVGW